MSDLLPPEVRKVVTLLNMIFNIEAGNIFVMPYTSDVLIRVGFDTVNEEVREEFWKAVRLYRFSDRSDEMSVTISVNDQDISFLFYDQDKLEMRTHGVRLGGYMLYDNQCPLFSYMFGRTTLASAVFRFDVSEETVKSLETWCPIVP